MYLIYTPLFYVNNKPHIGHKYNILLSLMYSRLISFLGFSYAIITGTDEHGEKVYKSYIEFILKNSNNKKFSFHDYIQLRREQFGENIFKLLEKQLIYHTDLYMHKKFVNYVFEHLFNKHMVYKGIYKGLYNIREEKYLIESDLHNISEKEKENFVIEKNEEGWYFSLNSDINKKIIDDIDNFIVRKKIKKEVEKILLNNKDIFITRKATDDSKKHSILIEKDRNFVFYVWFDAIQYYNSILKTYNLENIKPIIVIGKDILTFHCSLLTHVTYQLFNCFPYSIISHGMINVNNIKISKSYDNVYDLDNLIKKYSSLLESYLITFNIDNDINLIEEGIIAYENFLKNNVRNCYKRYFNLINLYSESIKNKWTEIFINIYSHKNYEYLTSFYSTISKENIKLDGQDLLDMLTKISIETNKMIHENEFWNFDENKIFNYILTGSFIKLMLCIESIILTPGIDQIMEKLSDSYISSSIIPLKVFDLENVDIKIFDLKY